MNEATKQFALAHADDDVRQLALQGCRDANVDLTVSLQQISGRQAARHKVPSWAAIDDIVYPVHLAMEQCSSEATARYKARLMAGVLNLVSPAKPMSPYKKMIDLTGGFGIDFAFLCELFDEGVYVERDEALCAIAHHNFQLLSRPGSFSVVNAEAEEFLHRLEEHVTLIFLDPARRDGRGGRTYGISDCTPNVLPLLEELLRKADYVLLKLSPMLDWRKAVSDVGREHVEQVHIVAMGGECKELLMLLSAKGAVQPLLVCSNDDCQETFPLFGDSEAYMVNRANGLNITAALEPHGPQKNCSFLYEPHAALMKAGVFSELAQRYGVTPLAPNSHLFIADMPVEGFPGRSFQIEDVSTMNKKELKEKVMPLSQANISVRNFPIGVDALRKKLKLNEGGSNYLFATTLSDGRHVIIICQKLL